MLNISNNIFCDYLYSISNETWEDSVNDNNRDYNESTKYFSQKLQLYGKVMW